MPNIKRQISPHSSKIERSHAWRNASLLLTIVMAALLVTLSVPGSAQADDCVLDLTFDQDGKVTTNFTKFNAVRSIALQPDGKIVAVGWVSTDTEVIKSALARYNTNGSLDRSFGTGGKVITIGSNLFAVALQADGKIVTVGTVDFMDASGNVLVRYGFGAIRYNHDGSLDTSFGQGGRVGIGSFFDGPPHHDKAVDVAIQPDGKIVIAGQTNENFDREDRQFAVARLNSDGSLDTSFGGDGTVATLFGDSLSRVYGNSLALQPDGKIVVGGYYRGTAKRNFALARYNTDGSLDRTFDGDGRVVTLLSGITDGGDRETMPVFVAVQPDGKILAAGTMEVPQRPDFSSSNDAFALARYNANGKLDQTFGTGGKVNTDFTYFAYNDTAHDMALQPDGKIVLVGYTRGNFGLARYNPNGSLDNTFDEDGKLVSRFACAGGSPDSLAIQADGKIIAAGTSNGNFLLARYPANPSSNGMPRLVSLAIDNPITPGIPNFDGIIHGSVSLCGAAPQGGLEVMLNNSNGAATVPATVTVPAGETSACFSIQTTHVNKLQTGVITAQLGGVSRRAPLVVRPIGVKELNLNGVTNASLLRIGYVYLEGAAPPGGITVTVSSSNPAIASPITSSFKIPAGQSFNTFYIQVAEVPDSRVVSIKATANGISQTALLRLSPGLP